LHHRFKAVTAMSPLQYQKQLRLQKPAVCCSAKAGWRVPVIEWATKASQFSRDTVVSSGVRHQEMPAECASLRERLTGGEWVASS
jgi:transcriptional regulator GlxA family with amidase domain